MSYFTKKNSGFSLIEVMLAVLVLSIGILAVSKLQTSLIRSGADANNRAKAAAIAERKIDDLRRFIGITDPIPGSWSASLTSPTSVFFDQIVTDQGGLIGPGSLADDPAFSITWAVNDYYYPTELSAPQLTPMGVKADFKKVSVLVSWVDVGNTTQNITLDTMIASYPPILTALSDDISAGPREGPGGLYTPLQAPDVVPVRITGDGVLKETSKPRPEVTKRDYATIVDFETVTYKPIDNGLFEALRREKFSTVACSCSTNRNVSPTVEHIYGYTTWDATTEQYIDYITTTTNSNSDNEDSFTNTAAIVECALCCKDGQYTDDQLTAGNNGQAFGFNGVDQTTAGTIDKVCRLKTIDGIRRVVAPWKLIGFNVIPASYFDSNSSSNALSNISSYSNYVTSLVRSTLGAVSDDSSLSAVSIDTGFKIYSGSGIAINSFYDIDYEHTVFNTPTSSRTIQARAIYMDYPPEGIYNNPTTSTNYTAANVPLDRIPFNEINMTGLVGWAPDEDNNSLTAPYTEQHDDAIQGGSVKAPCAALTNCISNQQLVNKSFGDYERGMFYPKGSPANVSAEARLYRSNDGIVDINVNSNTSVDSSINIQVN